MSTSLPIGVLLSVAYSASGAAKGLTATVSLPSALISLGTRALASAEASETNRSCSGARLNSDDDGAALPAGAWPAAAAEPGSAQPARPSSAVPSRAVPSSAVRRERRGGGVVVFMMQAFRFWIVG